jgi:DNA polymerase-3 subunit gamma/tau
MRDGLSLLDQAIAHGAGTVTAANVREMLGAVDETYLLRALDALAAGDGKVLMEVADEMQARSLSFDGALADLASLLLRIALAKAVPAALDADLPERARIFGFAAGLAAEEIQLYYQIAVQGRQDLPLAPDEHSGFVMTLLRMLAFRPEGGPEAPGGSLAVPTVAKPAGHSTPRPAAPSAPRAAAAPAPIAAAAARPAPAGAHSVSSFDGNWPVLARDLQLGGAAKLLAENSELQRHEGGQFELCVPKAMAYLTEKNYADKLKLALAQRFGGSVTLRVSVGEVRGKTVAAIEQGERTARQARAADAVHGDPFVRDLVDIFDATVIDMTINATSKGS